MPELVEVEVLLSKFRKFKKPIFNQIYAKSSRFSAEKANGLAVTDFKRKGKFILMQTEKPLLIVLHLGMSGAVLYGDHTDTETNVRSVFYLNEQSFTLIDPRGFGRFTTVLTKNLSSFSPTLSGLGFDPLDPNFPSDKAAALLEKHNKVKPMKQVLLEQKVLAGVGNYIADEALYVARVNPSSLNSNYETCLLVTNAILDICQTSLNNNGLSIRDYKLVDGSLGSFADYLRVYGRKGKECFTCSSILESVKISGRTSTFCGNCQKL